MRRIAYASPLNPAPSGISDYSEELLPYLAQYAAVTPYVDDKLTPTNADLMRHMDVRPLGKLAADHQRHPYDAIVYHMGNSPVHAAIWREMQRVPGVVVLHEWVLNHFMLNYAAVVEQNVGRYRAEAGRRYGADGERVADLMMRGRFVEAAFEQPLIEPVLEAAHGVIAHSRYVLDRVSALMPDLPAALVPMGVPLPPQIDGAEARARLGLPADALLLASFGHINPYKRLDAALRAIAALRKERDVRYVLVGSVSPSYDARAAIERAGLDAAVIATGYVERSAFEAYVAAADICLNLRHPTAGETSASLLRLLGAGKPTLVTASGSFTELPPGVAAQVDLDRSEGNMILAYCRLLATRPEIAAAMGNAAREYVAREHSLDGAAAGYIRFLAQRYGWSATPRIRDTPLWEGKNRELQNRKTTEPRTTEPRTENREQRTAEPQNRRTENRTTPYALRNTAQKSLQPSGSLNMDVARALADLGATEDDHPLLESAARAIADLGLDNAND